MYVCFHFRGKFQGTTVADRWMQWLGLASSVSFSLRQHLCQCMLSALHVCFVFCLAYFERKNRRTRPLLQIMIAAMVGYQRTMVVWFDRETPRNDWCDLTGKFRWTKEMFHQIFETSKGADGIGAASCCDYVTDVMRTILEYTNCCWSPGMTMVNRTFQAPLM